MLKMLQSNEKLNRRSSWLTLLGVCVAVAVLVTSAQNSTAWAFQDDAAGAGDVAGAPATTEEPAADAAAAPKEAAKTAEPAADSDTADNGEEGEEPVRQRKSFLSWLIEASGIFGLILLLLSFVMVALIMMNVLQVRRNVLLPPDFLEPFEEKMNAKDYQAAYEVARTDDSFVARVLAAGLSKLSRGYSEAIDSMQEVGEDESMGLEHRLSYLALIGSIAPMIGLTGTVYGMIMSFEEIANSATSPKPSELAAGISTALFTTLEGLVVAIPAMVAYGILRNHVARLVLEVGMVSEGMMARFSTAGKARVSGSSASASAPSASTKS